MHPFGMPTRWPLLSLSLRSLACLCGVLAMAGCGSRHVACDIAGTVTLHSEPLAQAEMSFYSPTTGWGFMTKVTSGTFVFPRVLKPGDYSVAFSPVSQEASAAGQQLPAPKVKIPAKYLDHRTSGITVTIRKGKNKVDIALE